MDVWRYTTVPSKGLSERLGLDDIISVLQQNTLRVYGHMLRKEDNYWVKKCMEYEVEGARPGVRPKSQEWYVIILTLIYLQRDCGKRLSGT